MADAFTRVHDLQPAAYGRLVGEVLFPEASREIALLARDDTVRHDQQRDGERGEEPGAVRPDRDPEVEQRESQVDRVSAETIGSAAHDRPGGPVRRERRSRRTELAYREREKYERRENERPPERGLERWRCEGKGADELERRPHEDRAQVEQRRARQDPRGVARHRLPWSGSRGTVATDLAHVFLQRW